MAGFIIICTNFVFQPLYLLYVCKASFVICVLHLFVNSQSVCYYAQVNMLHFHWTCVISTLSRGPYDQCMFYLFSNIFGPILY